MLETPLNIRLTVIKENGAANEKLVVGNDLVLYLLDGTMANSANIIDVIFRIVLLYVCSVTSRLFNGFYIFIVPQLSSLL